jgi:DNA-binding response OmpR family regulator
MHMGKTPHGSYKTFLLTWLVIKENIISRTGAPASVALQCQTNPRQRILVIEDNTDIRSLNTEVLTESGFHVDAAEDGLVALHALNTDHYDLLIIDNDMAMVTGLELVEKLRSEDLTLPVILVLGTMPTGELNRNPWLQIQAILLKPYTLAELFRTVREVLRAASSGAREQFAPPSNWQRLPSAVGLRL